MSWKFDSVAIVGSGAIGLYYGGRLAEIGKEVKFLARSDYDALSRHGLTVESVDGNFQLSSVRAFRTPQEIGPVDLVIVAWKATTNPQLEAVLPPLLHGNTQVLTLQNGLGNCETLAKWVGDERVLGGLCFVCINRTGPGVVAHTAGGKMAVGEWVRDSRGRASVVAEAFQNAKVPAVATDDLEKSQWEKLVWNIPFNGLSIAEGGVTTDVLLQSPGIEQELRELMREVIAAATALGHPLAEALVDFNIERTRPMGPYRTSSMIDFTAGREVEVQAIWGEPLRRALAAGVAMPRTQDLLKRIEMRLSTRDSGLAGK